MENEENVMNESFAEELEHTKAYLSVEQVRFEGMLFVEFYSSYYNTHSLRLRQKIGCQPEKRTYMVFQ